MRRHPEQVAAGDIEGLVATVVGIDLRLERFRQRLDRFADGAFGSREKPAAGGSRPEGMSRQGDAMPP